MEQRMRYMRPLKDIIIIDKKKKELAVVNEGTGDNLWEEDEAQGYKDYAMLSLYSIDGDELTPMESGQMMTTKLIADMTDDEYADDVRAYFDLDKDSIVIKL